MKRWEERTDRTTGERYLAVLERGAALRDDALLNKGTCFSREERERLGLRGILPPAVATAEEQEARAYENYLRVHDDVQRYLFLTALQDRNETLFFRLLLHHLDEMVPIVYTPTVGSVCERYSHIYRRPRGLYLSAGDRGHFAEILREARRDECRILVVTDNEAILGIGDQGVGGMGIAIGKLALYTAGAGIHPASGLPLDLDVGTDNTALLADPIYLGLRQPRLRGDAYFELLDELVAAIAEGYPGALVQWEDFANRNAFRILDRYRGRMLSFNDDIQGTGAVVVAGVRNALAHVGRRLQDERMVFFGAGAAGAGSARAMRSALRAAGVSQRAMTRHVLCMDSRGLILSDRPGLEGEKLELAGDAAVARDWSLESVPRLLDVVRNFRPTVLVGASGQPQAFSEEVVRTMRRGCDRPIILPLSNPTSHAEARPEDLVRWTDGAAVVGTGSPFPSVQYQGSTFEIGQGNNVLIFPGVGLGAVAVGARWLPDEAFAAAAHALSEFAPPGSRIGAPIFPPLSRLREVSRAVALAVARALVETEAAPSLSGAEIDRRIAESVWEPVYRPYRPARPSGSGAPEPLVAGGELRCRA